MAVVIIVAAVAITFFVHGRTVEPTGPKSIQAASLPPKAGPGKVRSMMPPGSTLRGTIEADLNGDGVNEIVASADRPTGGLVPQPYVRAWTWTGSSWRTIFNAQLSRMDPTLEPPTVLRTGTATSGQVVRVFDVLDMGGSKGRELILAVESVGTPVGEDLWVLSFPRSVATVSYYAHLSSGTKVAMAGRRILLTPPSRFASTPEGRAVVAFDQRTQRITLSYAAGSS